MIVYLDPEHEDFSADGKSMIRSRWVRAEDGTIQEHAWVFNEIGIDTILNELSISQDHAEIEAEDELTAAMDTAALHPENDMEREEKKGVGQIEVILERVVLLEKWTNYDYQQASGGRDRRRSHEWDKYRIDTHYRVSFK